MPQFVQRGATSRSSFAASQNGRVESSAWLWVRIDGNTPCSLMLRSVARRVPLTGSAAGPPVTSATSAPSTWLIAVPRICSTASRTCVMPMM